MNVWLFATEAAVRRDPRDLRSGRALSDAALIRPMRRRMAVMVRTRCLEGIMRFAGILRAQERQSADEGAAPHHREFNIGIA